MSSGRTPIGEILLRHEHLRRRELERILAEDRKQRLVSTLILRAEIDVDEATLALSEQSGYPGALERHLEQRDLQLAKEFPQARFRWLDLEDDAEEVGDREVENFPTILVERDGAELFYGPLLPHHEHLRRLLQSLETA